MAATETQNDAIVNVPDAPRSPLSTWWVILGFGVLLAVVLGWSLIKDPTISAPTRDPAWYTWRSNLIVGGTPGDIAREWGPDSVFSGGYRVATPLTGALMQQVAGIDQYSFSGFLMVLVPVLAGMALGAAGFRSRKDPILVLIAMFAGVTMLLTTPYIGYMDDLTMLFVLCVMLAFITQAQESWGARVALFMLGLLSAYLHPTTCVLFGLSLMAVFGWRVLTSRFHFGEALKRDGPMLMSIGFGMILGLATWVAGIWGTAGNLKDAAAPPPYTKAFFKGRLDDWVASMHPLISVPLILVAVGGVILWSRRERKPAIEHEISAIWWMLPFAGALTFLVSKTPVPYYRFMNASAAPVVLVGLGTYFLVRWLLDRFRQPTNPSASIPAGTPQRPNGLVRVAALAGVVVVLASVGWMFIEGLNYWRAQPQWANQSARTSLAAISEVAAAAGERPLILLMNYNDKNDPATGTNTAYGWAKTYTNVFRTGLPATSLDYQATYLGTLENLLKNTPTVGANDSPPCPVPATPAEQQRAKDAGKKLAPSDTRCGYTTISYKYWYELSQRMEDYPATPAVFVVGQWYGGDGDKALPAQDGETIGPDVTLITKGSTEFPVWTPSQDVIAQAKSAAAAKAEAFANPPGRFSDPMHLLQVIIGMFLLFVLPGLLAAPFFEIDDTPSRLALIPAMSFTISVLSGVVVLSVWRGSLTTFKAWVVVALAVGVGAVLRVAKQPVTSKLTSFGNFFNKLFSQFSNPDYATLMGVQFLAQTGQGVVQGAIAKALVFGGQKGFDVQNVPSASYLLKVVLALYVPYTVISPFVGVFIDRFSRRRVVWWSNVITAVIVGGIALGVMLPLGKGTTEHDALATVGLVIGLLAAQSVVRVVLAVKSAAIPDVLVGKDLLQGNALSQAGGALFQVLGIGFGGVFAGIVGSWAGAIIGAIIFVLVAIISLRMRHTQSGEHETTFWHEASRVVKTVSDGLREVASRPAAALGLSSFQMLRYQFWGFGLFVFGLYAKNLVQGSSADNLSLALSGLGGIVGGALGLVLAQKWKDRVPPIRMLMGSMFLLGAGTIVFGAMVSVLGFAGMLFIGFFAFFLGKISADTIMQQAMPDDFRGRAFALFDIAYNLGFIVPALILSFIWVEGSATRTRIILVGSGAVFLGLTALVGAWSRRIKDQFAPQDDLVAK